MLIDSRHLQPGHVITADVCIVGGGPAGITVLRELAKRQIDACLLESGGLEADGATQALAAGENIGLPYFPLKSSRARRFGGSANLWFSEMSGRSRVLDTTDFDKRAWINDSGWPFARERLDPYYRKAQSVMGLGPYRYDVAAWEDVFRLRLPLDDRRFFTTVFQFAPKDTFRNYLGELQSTPGVRVFLHANVLEVEAAADAARVERLRVTTIAGTEFEARARIYILAAGGIENARLLLLSRSAYAAGLGNGHDLVGRYFMEHPHLASGHILPVHPNFVGSMGLYDAHTVGGTPIRGALATSFEVQRAEGIGNFSASLHRTSVPSATSRAVRSLRTLWRASRDGRLGLRAMGPTAVHLRNIILRPDQVTRFLVRRLLRPITVPSIVELMVMSEQVPNPMSRVLLSDKRDQFGRQLPALDWRLTEQDARTIQRSQEVLDEELKRAGIGSLRAKYGSEKEPPLISGGWHHMGTTRMHNDLKRGVVDENCRVHEVSNLFIAGSSVFPTGGYANPTLTIVALALRLAAHVHEVLTGVQTI